MKNIFLVISILMTGLEFIFPQSLLDRYSHFGEMFVPQFSSAPFPHPERANGRLYNNQTFSAQEHYSDSSVAIFIPKGFKPTAKINIVVYFHGWYNNIDTACAQFKLIEQFSESEKNAIFIFPEGPKNSPDSFGGRMEEKDGLKNLVADVLKFLKQQQKIKSEKAGNIILAGHSGAFRVISFCLMRGGLTKNISDVILFDALYGQTEKYSYWIDHYQGRFINIYTNDGGTKNETENLMADLDAWEIPYIMREEDELTETDLKKNRIVFIHSSLSHNEVIVAKNQFYRFLSTSSLK
ncbi:MAG: hypothetical protein Q8L88_05470 [Bacteroidota bacterium]|nr:hypothetical protein [Bacteroidota bacterium]